MLKLKRIKILSEPQHGFCKDNRDSLIPNRECRGQTKAVCKMEEIVVTMEDGTDKMLFIERSCNNKRDGKLLLTGQSMFVTSNFGTNLWTLAPNVNFGTEFHRNVNFGIMQKDYVCRN